MTENQALLLNGLVGCVVTCGCVVLLNALGVADQIQGVAAMLGLCGFSFMFGVIGNHYLDKAGPERKDPDER